MHAKARDLTQVLGQCSGENNATRTPAPVMCTVLTPGICEDAGLRGKGEVR